MSTTIPTEENFDTNKPNWQFPRTFWTANIVELFERAAYYGVFIAITLYLSRVVGFDDIEAAWIGGIFAAGLYFLPPFTGALADKIGFRNAIILAFALLSIGYFSLGALPYKVCRSAFISCTNVWRVIH